MKTKRKAITHVIEKKSLQIIQNTFPDYWTTRQYMPDYGIDLEVEIFEATESNGVTFYDTLGEHIFIQVKGTECLNVGKYKVYKRKNIEKYKVEKTEEYQEIDVVKFQIDTTELSTIERMSSAIPVLLFIVDINNEDIYFICLNDYIDKVLIPEEPNYYDKDSKTLYIPLENKITS